MSNVTFTSSSTWQCPAGIYRVMVECWGAGRSGGNVNDRWGGGGGGYARTNYATVKPGHTYTVHVDAANGEASTYFQDDLSTVITRANSAVGQNGGALSGMIGDLTVKGGDGGTGDFNVGGGAGGGGGCAGTNGGNGTSSTPGSGGTGGYGGGNGGNGAKASSATNGTAPGGGGGGANNVVYNGGTGANGQISLTYLAITNLVTCTIS